MYLLWEFCKSDLQVQTNKAISDLLVSGQQQFSPLEFSLPSRNKDVFLKLFWLFQTSASKDTCFFTEPAMIALLEAHQRCVQNQGPRFNQIGKKTWISALHFTALAVDQLLSCSYSWVIFRYLHFHKHNMETITFLFVQCCLGH